MTIMIMTILISLFLTQVIHEMLHTLGFLHMHTAELRDDFVRINYNNIIPKARKNFEKYKTFVSMYGTQYDYRSIMHYSKNAFAADQSRRTITPLERVRAMGQRQGDNLQCCVQILLTNNLFSSHDRR